MFRWITGSIVLALIAASAYIWTEMPELRENFFEQIAGHELVTFEIKYTPEQIVQRYQKHVSEKGVSYDEPLLEFYPYLLLDVKYVRHQSSFEGQLLWGLGDGEIVLNSHTWSTTHGYDDCLMARATADEMRVIHALAENGGHLDRTGILNSLKQDAAQIDDWLERCRKKQLITQTGNHWKLHMQMPRFCLEPTSEMKESFVDRPRTAARIMPARYRSSQIIELSKAAFGQDFAIKRSQEVFLPVYNLTFKYADGSKRTMRFNAYSNTLYP